MTSTEDRTSSDGAFLRGESIALRPLVLQDADGPYPSWLNDSEVCRYNRHCVWPYLPEHARSYIESTRATRSDLVLAIVDGQTGRHIGNVALHGVDSPHRTGEFAILIGDRAAWGKGVGAEAGLLLLRHGFEELALHRIECATTENNVGMRGLAKRLGMREEGVRRGAVWKRGRYLNVVEFGILADEFGALFGGGVFP